jgi:hypothetical protein
MIFFGLVIGRQWLAQLFKFHQLCFVRNALVLLIPHRGWVDRHPLQQPLELYGIFQTRANHWQPTQTTPTVVCPLPYWITYCQAQIRY